MKQINYHVMLVSHVFHIKMCLQSMTGKQNSFNIIINWRFKLKWKCMAIVTPENLEHSFLQAPHSSVLSSDTLPLFIANFFPESNYVFSYSIWWCQNFALFVTSFCCEKEKLALLRKPVLTFFAIVVNLRRLLGTKKPDD